MARREFVYQFQKDYFRKMLSSEAASDKAQLMELCANHAWFSAFLDHALTDGVTDKEIRSAILRIRHEMPKRTLASFLNKPEEYDWDALFAELEAKGFTLV